MINDLGLSTQLGCNRWKYVDDITLSDTLLRDQSSCLQSDLDRIHQWAVDNNMRLNPSRCKIMRMCFFREQPVLPVFTIDGKPLDSVFSHKFLGLTLQSDLGWNAHVDSIVPRAAKRLYILLILRCSNLSQPILLLFMSFSLDLFLNMGRVLLGTSAFLYFLVIGWSLLKKRALRIILPHYSYASVLQTLNLPSLLLRRESLCSKSFSKFTSLANSRFLPLLPPRRRDANDSATSLRNSSNFTLPAVRTERFKRSFIPSMLFSQ